MPPSLSNRKGLCARADRTHLCPGGTLEPYAIRTTEETGAILGISKQAVQQIEARAWNKIRRKLLPLYQEYFGRPLARLPSMAEHIDNLHLRGRLHYAPVARHWYALPGTRCNRCRGPLEALCRGDTVTARYSNDDAVLCKRCGQPGWLLSNPAWKNWHVCWHTPGCCCYWCLLHPRPCTPGNKPTRYSSEIPSSLKSGVSPRGELRRFSERTSRYETKTLQTDAEK